MKKENILVVVLIALAIAGGILYNRSKSSGPMIQAATASETSDKAGEKTDLAMKGTTIGWRDYTPGMAMAAKRGKSIFLYFHAPWCTYCTKLKETTFKDKKVLAYLDKNFISIQVNTDKNQALSNEWKVKGLPTLWFLESDGTKINSIPGYLDAAQLLLVLKYIHTKSYDKMSFQDFMRQG
jgi:thioredoxin-related protein